MIEYFQDQHSSNWIQDARHYPVLVASNIEHRQSVAQKIGLPEQLLHVVRRAQPAGLHQHRDLPASKARAQFADILNEVAFNGERVLLHRHGKAVAAVISADDLALLEALEDQMDIEAVLETLKEGGPNVPWSQLKSEAASS